MEENQEIRRKIQMTTGKRNLGDFFLCKCSNYEVCFPVFVVAASGSIPTALSHVTQLWEHTWPCEDDFIC